MGRCRHRKVTRFVWDLSGNRAHRWLGAYASDDAHAVICQRCGAWLSLGPSNDDHDLAKIEMRAAAMYACAVTSLELDRCDCPAGKLSETDEEIAHEIYGALWGV